MLIEKRAQYYLKRARASAKEKEFDVPDELQARKDVNVDELFPLTIACISDLSVKIAKENISVEEVKNYYDELYFSSKFYDSYLYINNSDNTSDRNYFYLVGAIAYYLCDQIGSSLVLAKKINIKTLNLSSNQLDILICAMLQNVEKIVIDLNENNIYSRYIKQFTEAYNKLMSTSIKLNLKWVAEFRNVVYDTQNDRDIFLIDALLAIFILKTNYSIFNLLPKHSPISAEALTEIVGSNHFVREMWPSQRYMCKLGFFNGKSGVVQMPTGAGKTKAVSIAIYSSFCKEANNLSVVIAPFRALCREISDDLRTDLEFDGNIRVSEISDLLQIDFELDDLFNPNRKTVVVTTPEKFLYILRQNDGLVDSISQLIFDEGHLFDDEERGATYELLIASILNKIDVETQKILISAIIPNVDEINTWFAGNEGIPFKGDSISTVDKLPSVLRWEHTDGNKYCYLYYIDKENKDNFDFYVPRIIRIEPLSKIGKERLTRYFPSVDFSNNRMRESNDMAIACLLKIANKDNTAIFCGRKDSANKILQRIIELHNRKYDISSLKKRASENEISRLSNLIKENYGKTNFLYSAAQLGVFAHHRGITDGVKNSIEYALRKTLITNVVCTSTLAQGVNLPIKYLVISSIYQSNEKIKVRDFHNLIGRTARSGMFTEGTIIFSDPFVYGNRNNDWKWSKYKELLDFKNSEKCSSVLLDIVRSKEIENYKYTFFNVALRYYDEREKLTEKITTYFHKYNNDKLKNWYNHIIKTLGKLENYIATIIADNDNTYSDDLVDEMLNGTLAETLATDDEKTNLRELFVKICEYLVRTMPEEQVKRNFSKSLIKSEDYVALQEEVTSFNYNEMTYDDLLEFLLKMIMKYGSTNNLNKMESVQQVVVLAKLWMQGTSYHAIKDLDFLYDFKIMKRGNYVDLAIEDVLAICDGDFGYSSSLIISSIVEMLSSMDTEGEYFETIEEIKKIGQQLKYGLEKQTEILIYELGFNDRYIAKEITKMIGEHSTKKNIKKAIKVNEFEINIFLDDFPSLYQERLHNL